MKKFLMILSVFVCVSMVSQSAVAGWAFSYAKEKTSQNTLVTISDPTKQKCVEQKTFDVFSEAIMQRYILMGAHCQDVSTSSMFSGVAPHTILCALNGKQAVFIHWFENEKKCRITNMKNLLEQLKE